MDASQLAPHANDDSLLDEDASIFNQAAQLVCEGNKIAAIRLVHIRYDVSLKVGKDAVDLIEKGQQVDKEDWLIASHFLRSGSISAVRKTAFKRPGGNRPLESFSSISAYVDPPRSPGGAS